MIKNVTENRMRIYTELVKKLTERKISKASASGKKVSGGNR